MTEYLTLGSVPAEEACEQLGPNYDEDRARLECRTYADQLRRQFPEWEVKGVRFTTKSNPHDFGSYLEVNVAYNDDNETAADYAFEIENNMPGLWDAESRKALGLPGEAAAAAPALTSDQSRTFAQLLKAKFPWLDSDDDDSVSGADAVDAITGLYSELKGARS